MTPVSADAEDGGKVTPLTPLQHAYLRARIAGKPPAAALREAGYKPGNRRSATSMASRIEARIAKRPEIIHALEAGGLTPELIAEQLLDDLMMGEPKDRAALYRTLGKWLGWEKVEVEINDPLAGVAHEQRQAVAEELRAEIKRRGAARGDGGPERGR